MGIPTIGQTGELLPLPPVASICKDLWLLENLVDHKVKVIRCDNGTEFKNREMNLFCDMKGILRQFSIAITPQQNIVVERRNKTLIEAARTMLANSKLPTTFWAEAVSSHCYVQNRVLVVKPHNKTPYELFHGRTPTLCFMRPFGCPITILNTIDHLGIFDGKAHKGSGPDWLFDIDAITRIMNYEPIVAGTQSNGFVGTKGSDNAGHARKETKPVKDYILLPFWTVDPNLQVMMERSSTVNVAGTNEVNAVGGNMSIELPFDQKMPALEDDSIFDFSSDDEDDGAVADMNNLDTTIQVSLIPTTRIHKDHPLDQVIGDLQSATQTRKMSKNLEEHGFILDVPCEGAYVFIDRWRLDELAYGIPSDGPCQTNPPSIEDIISTIRTDREGQVCCIHHEEEIDVHDYQL
ncbi:putative ribonuclease H-like domain-containing protein [Tanacetum coccineum]